MKDKWKRLMEEYAGVAIGVYLGIFAIVFSGFALAISQGVQVESTAGQAGLLGAAWVATKLTQPFRIAGTLLLTPLVAKLIKRKRE